MAILQDAAIIQILPNKELKYAKRFNFYKVSSVKSQQTKHTINGERLKFALTTLNIEHII